MGAQNISMALKSIKVSRWRSFMTMTGIIIGVVSVITIVSLGEGVKRQVVSQVGRLGDDLVVVRSGNSLVRDKTGGILSVNKLSNLSFENSNLARGDLDIVSKTSEAKHFSPLGLLRSGVSVENVQHNDVTVLASNEQLAELLKLPLAYGAFFREQEVGSHLAVIGKAIAEKIFKENVPIGRTLTIRGEDFVVLGVMADMPTSPFVLEPDLNQSVIIPYPVGEMTNGGVQLVEILATADDGTHTQQLMSALTKSIRKSHKNQDDFSVLRNGESLAVTSDILVTFTAFIAGVAAMSLLVGGIGIMNIMLVSVTERTREIGIRKALGATNRQIAMQFFVEALVLSGVGGFIGLVVAYIINAIVRATTHLDPVITWPAVAVAALVCLSIGIVFGTIPAIRAARKDPIESLRYE